MAYATAADLQILVPDISTVRADGALALASTVIDAYVSAGDGTIPATAPNGVRVANLVMAHRIISVGESLGTSKQEAIGEYSYRVDGFSTVEAALTLDSGLKDLLSVVMPIASGNSGLSTLFTTSRGLTYDIGSYWYDDRWV